MIASLHGLHVGLLLPVVRALLVHVRAILRRHTLPLLLGVLGLCRVHHGSLVLRGLRILRLLLLGSLHHLRLLHARLISVLAILTAGHLRLLHILGGLPSLYPRLLLAHHLLLLVGHVLHARLGGLLVRVCGRLGPDRFQLLAFEAAGEELLTVIVRVVTGVDGDGKLHLGRNNQVITILHAHLGEALRLAGDGLLALDVDVHLLLLDELTELRVLDLAEDDVLEDLETLVRAYLDLERLVQLVVEIRRLNGDVEVERPGLFLAVSPRVLSGRHLAAVHAGAVGLAHHHLVLIGGCHLTSVLVLHHLGLEGAHLLLHLLVHSLHLLMHELPADGLLHLVLLRVPGLHLLVALALAHHGLLLELVLLQHLLVVPLLLLRELIVVVHGAGFRGNDVFG